MNVSPRCLRLTALTVALASCAGTRHDHADSRPPHLPYVVNGADARTIDFPGHTLRVLLDARAQEGDVAVFEITVPPRTLAAPPHVHRDEDEFFFVLEGELVFLSEDAERRSGPGTAVNLPRGHLHGFWNATDAPARALLAITPAHFGSFFDDVVAEIRTRQPADPGAVGALLTEVAARYGCEIDGGRVGSIVERYGLR